MVVCKFWSRVVFQSAFVVKVVEAKQYKCMGWDQFTSRPWIGSGICGGAWSECESLYGRMES